MARYFKSSPSYSTNKTFSLSFIVNTLAPTGSLFAILSVKSAFVSITLIMVIGCSHEKELSDGTSDSIDAETFCH